MNIESANIRAHKSVIEDEIGLRLIVIPRKTGNINYELHDGEGRFIKESRQLQTIVNFISTHFNYSYFLLEDRIHGERLRLIKENHNILLSAQRDAEVRVNRENNKSKQPVNKSKPKHKYKVTCPHCSFHRCIIKLKDKEGFFIQYECKNCCRSHIRNPEGKVMKGDRNNIKKKIIKEFVNVDTIDILIEDRNITI